MGGKGTDHRWHEHACYCVEPTSHRGHVAVLALQQQLRATCVRYGSCPSLFRLDSCLYTNGVFSVETILHAGQHVEHQPGCNNAVAGKSYMSARHGAVQAIRQAAWQDAAIVLSDSTLCTVVVDKDSRTCTWKAAYIYIYI